MNSESSFLEALSSNPADDNLLLAYAEWPTQQGDPRGEYIGLLQTPQGNRPQIVALRKVIDKSWLEIYERDRGRDRREMNRRIPRPEMECEGNSPQGSQQQLAGRNALPIAPFAVVILGQHPDCSQQHH